MRKVILLLGILTLLVVSAFAADWITKKTQWDFRMTYFAALTLASGTLSLFIAAQRLRLRRQFLLMSKHEAKNLADDSKNTKSAFPIQQSRSSTLTACIGIAAVNIPTVPIFVGPLFVLQTWFSAAPPLPQFAALVCGLISAWLWWSIAVSRWRRWAERGGMSVAEIRCCGEKATILWPSGHFFEKTEWANIQAKFRNGA